VRVYIILYLYKILSSLSYQKKYKMIYLYSNQHYLNVSLGTQRRTIVNINDSFKTIVKGVGLEKEIKLAADKMAADMIEISKKTENC